MNPSYPGYRALMLVLFGRSGQPPAWRSQAACAGQDTEEFFDPQHAEEVMAVCLGCPVLAECRADQLAWESSGQASRRYYAAGTVAGLSGPDRKRLHYPRKDVA
ncbi:WhiB family transcriptional regulator [Umezawaea tangerina]|uniref:WhiB family redox-sensing transcriptional regulator n=1 Tax=Umezawaea tangerina TaxID=84725 RepID=A0A2T0TM56_9PSEU|nr:WhiB family transcriptional regulator [Umezawaea tangerina]PRY46608.1 WhiB family redox-sensing transcriptional regulator [Umezawaea tangerina]